MKEKKSKGKKIETCVYCGAKANSIDHIPSRNLFTPKSLIKARFQKVGACVPCNRGFSKDEEFFRNYLVTSTQEHSENATRLFYSKVRRSIERRPAIGQGLLNNMPLVDVFTPSGIIVGKKTKIEIPKIQVTRMFNVMDKYVKGLVSVHLDTPLTEGYVIRHCWTDENDPVFEDENFIKRTIFWNKDNLNTFIYGYARLPGTLESAWIFIFFMKIPIISFVLSENSHRSKLFPKNFIRFHPDLL